MERITAGTFARIKETGASSSSDITTHSVCHPGRPGPHGESHVGSPGLAFFHRTKSSGERFSSLTSMRAPARSESSGWRASVP